ncbi:hypothetical protein E1292_23075 [Nonomuraea deserti]|uniref:Cupin domain-containing protein n=1 Tax=Nonomuraea deserti TaxID=1848322 RepID=A0A4R4VCR0_9ACTN|nr:hypothetical protein [Nonomuraea deserti]TDD02571.1 hypothetical protein E1292_23075 [Nonomuraea deserti]
MKFLDELPLAGAVVGTDFSDWPVSLRDEFQANAHNGHVGGLLLHESERVRVWQVKLAPGERLPAHRHVLDYFWTALTDGRSRQHTHDGTTREVSYRRGETREYVFGSGEYLLHDLENIGGDDLAFITVEQVRSANPPLPLS